MPTLLEVRQQALDGGGIKVARFGAMLPLEDLEITDPHHFQWKFLPPNQGDDPRVVGYITASTERGYVWGAFPVYKG